MSTSSSVDALVFTCDALCSQSDLDGFLPSGVATSIHLCGWYGSPEYILEGILREYGHSILNLQDMYGNTALHYATLHGLPQHEQCAIALLNHGASPYICNNEGQTVSTIMNHRQLSFSTNQHWCRNVANVQAWALAAIEKDCNILLKGMVGSELATQHALNFLKLLSLGLATSSTISRKQFLHIIQTAGIWRNRFQGGQGLSAVKA